MGKIDFDKFLIDYTNSGFSKKRMMVNYLLEQQGLQIVNDEIVPIKDNKEPKFKVGDKVVNDGKVCTIKIVNEDNYIVNNGERDIQVHFSYTKDWKLVEQKPAWSEEDERIHQCLIKDQEEVLDKVRNSKYGHSEIIDDLKETYRERINWLKSLKDRYTWRPSENQMKSLEFYIKNDIDREGVFGANVVELYNDLKKLM